MNITALNITAGSLKALALRGTALNTQEVPLAPGAIKNGLVLQPETMGREIRSFFQSGNLSAGRVICTVNGLPFTYRVFTLPAMDNAAFPEAVLRTAKQEMSISPEEMYLTWQAYPATNGEYQVLVAGITRRPVDNLIKALSYAGISPWLLDLPHMALARLCPYKDAVIVDFEKDCSNIVMIVDGVPRGMHMVTDISAGASLQDQVGQVMEKLARMVEFYNGSHPANQLKEPLKILVTGELLEDEKALEFIRPQAGYAIEPLASAKHALPGKSIRRIAVNTGMLDIQLESGKDSIPGHYMDMGAIVREGRPKTNIAGLLKKIAVPVAVFAGIGLLTVSYLSLGQYRADIDKLQVDLSRANAGLTQKQAALAQSKALTAQIDKASAVIYDIKAGQQVIFNPRKYVAEVASVIACLPKNVTVDSLDISAKSISLKGVASDPAQVIVFADNLEKSGGFAQAIITWIDKPQNSGGIPLYHFKIAVTK